MKAFVLGAYGKAGLVAVELLAQDDTVTQIAVAGRDLERAEAVAATTGSKAVAIQADGTDEEALASLLAGYDILVNAAYNETVLPAIRAAIRSGAHYCDVAWGKVLDEALQLSSEAEAAGITAIPGNGVSPCVSNLMGVHVARQLEEVEQLQLGRAGVYNFDSGQEVTPRTWLKDPQESLAALHDVKPFFTWMLRMVQEKHGPPIRTYGRRGGWEDADPLVSGVDVPTAQGGTAISLPYSSTGVVFGELPRGLGNAPPVIVMFSPFPPQLHDVLREQALRVLEGQVDHEAATDTFYDTVERDPDRWLTVPDGFSADLKMWARAVGRREGRAARFTCWFAEEMWDVGGYYLTSATLVHAALRILRGEVQERGVMTAEMAFEPRSYFAELAALLPELGPDGRLVGESLEWLG